MMSETPAMEEAGSQLGRYRLLELIGEGGMGTIWLAEQREPVKRRVALKIVKLGMDTKEVIARFEAERQALAMMDDPHIAKVFDAGVTDTGRPYFVMEYIKGVPILEYCDREKVDTRERLGLFIRVCQAIQHAHQKGVIHRDIKPSNVLVTLLDGAPVPKVIDFGVAKAIHSELTAKTLFTEHGRMIGTPAYMSPEQAQLTGLDIDTRSDVYSLGVLLYELLTGTTPFDMQELLSRGFGEMMRAIREDEPHKPSTRISSLGETGTATARQRGADVKRLGTLLRGDIDWIVMKCLEKDRARRYETANGLAADIRRYLNDEPVTAGPPGAAYKLRKFVKRNRVQVVAAGAVFVALIAGVVGTSWGLVASNRARAADLQRRLEEEQRSAAESARLNRNAEAVSALLAESEAGLRASDASRARLALNAAKKRAEEGGAGKDLDRIERLSADLEILAALDDLDQLRYRWADNRFVDAETLARRTREALRGFGADPAVVSLEEAARRVQASTVRERIVTALDRRMSWEKDDGVRALLRRVDADGYRDAVRDAVHAGDGAKVSELGGRTAALEQLPGFAVILGANGDIDVRRRVELLQAVLLRRPSDVNLLMTLAYCYPDGDRRGAGARIRCYQAAVAAAPDNAAAYQNLGVALYEIGGTDEAVTWFLRSLEIHPKNSSAFHNLGSAMATKGRIDEAIAYFRKALEIEPTQVPSLLGLAKALSGHSQREEAAVLTRRAVELAPWWAEAQFALGVEFHKAGRRAEAILQYRKALELDPGHVPTWRNLGNVLDDTGQVEEATSSYRKAIELDPNEPGTYYDLAIAMQRQGAHDEALAALRRSAELGATYAAVYYGLGVELAEKDDGDGAMAAYRKAIEIDPGHAEAHCNLASWFTLSGRLAEALEYYRKGHELGSRRADWSNPSADWVRKAELRVAIETKLPAFLAGETRARDHAERVELANVCYVTKRYRAAARFSAEIFAAEPASADDLGEEYRYQAARNAAMAAAGRGEDAEGLGDDERARLGRQALDWLRADLGLHAKRLETGQPEESAAVDRMLSKWQTQSDLAGLRDTLGLASLPVEDRNDALQLWVDVAALRKKAGTSVPTERPR